MNPHALLMIRLGIGISMLTLGLVRLPKLEAFAMGMSSKFENSILPMVLVLPFGYVLPFIELVIGILLILGYKTQFIAILGSLTMIALIFGTGLIEQWGNLQLQFIYLAFFAVLIHSGGGSYCLSKNKHLSNP